MATVTFDIAEGATGSTGLNLVKTSNAAGFGFEGLSHNVVISAEAVEDNSDSSGSDMAPIQDLQLLDRNSVSIVLQVK